MTKPARAFIVDPALALPIGHHLNFHRTLADEFRRRGITPVHFAHRGCDDDMVRGLHVAKLFRYSPYFLMLKEGEGTPADNFRLHADHFAEDMAVLKPGLVGASDLVVLPVVAPGMLMGYVRWWAGLPPDARPRTVITFHMSSGLRSVVPEELDTSSPTYDGLADCYRMIGDLLATIDCSRLHLMAVTARMIEHFSHLLRQPFALHPFYRVFKIEDVDPVAEAFERSAAPPTLGFLGDQRVDKGFDLVPDVLELLLDHHPTVEFVVQSSGVATDSDLVNNVVEDASRRIRELAARTSRLRLLDGFVSLDSFSTTLARMDMLLQPYLPSPYGLLPSGIFNDAAAIGRASVVPSGTWMAEQVAVLDGLGAIHDGYEPATIADAALALLARTPELRKRGPELRRRWNTLHGTDRLVEFMLATIGE